MNVFIKLFAELNLGDDLFLKILVERYPSSNFILNARKEYKQLFSKYTNLQISEDMYVKKSRDITYKIRSNIERKLFPVIYKKNLQRDIENQYGDAFKKSDVFVSIGGSIFMQPRILPYYADVEYYKIVNKEFNNIFYIGCNFGPYTDLNYKNSYDKIFDKATDVCFREEASYKLFSDLNSVRYRPDVVFGLDVVKIPKRSKSVGFSIVSPRNGVNEKLYIRKYVDLVEFYQKKNYEIYFFSFCKKQGDEDIIESIISELKEDNVNRVYYDGDIDEFLRIYSSVEKVYCGRFHSMILSMIFEQQIFPISYSKKMVNVLDDIEYKGQIINIEDFYSINPSELDDQIAENKYNVSEQIAKSKGQFEKLDILLK